MQSLDVFVGHRLPTVTLQRWLDAARKLQAKVPSLILHVRALQHHVDAHALQRLANVAQKAVGRLDDPEQSRIAAELMADADRLRRELLQP